MLRILVADDSERFRLGLVRALERDGRATVVAQAGDGVAALEALRSDRPDIAVIDARMPRLDGLGVVAEATRDPELAAVPLVVLSATADEVAVEALRAGAVACLDKNRSRRELCDAIIDAGQRGSADAPEPEGDADAAPPAA